MSNESGEFWGFWVIATDNKKYVRWLPSKGIQLVHDEREATVWCRTMLHCNTWRMTNLAEIVKAGCHASNTQRLSLETEVYYQQSQGGIPTHDECMIPSFLSKQATPRTPTPGVPRKEWTDAPSNLGAIDPRGAWAMGWNACALLVEHLADVAKIRPEAVPQGFPGSLGGKHVIAVDGGRWVKVTNDAVDRSRFSIELTQDKDQARCWPMRVEAALFLKDFVNEIRKAGCTTAGLETL